MREARRVGVSVVVVSYNTKDLTVGCVRSVLKHMGKRGCEVIVVDNASTDGSVPALSKIATQNREVKLVKLRENMGFAGANNIGTQRSKGKYILFLNSDALVEDRVIEEMVEWMDEHPKVGIATCALKNKDGSLQGTGGYFPSLVRVFSWMVVQDLPGVDWLVVPFHPKMSFYRRERELDWVTGAFMLVRRKVLEDGVRWDEDYFMYTEDVDFCYQAKRKGWGVVYLPRWSIVHFGGASGTKEGTILGEYRGVKRFYRKYYPGWQYLLLRLLLKTGALGRMMLFGILEGRKSFLIYAKAFHEA